MTKLNYLPGETVTGYLVYNATKDRKIRNIRLDFVGKVTAATKFIRLGLKSDPRMQEHVYWVEQYGSATVEYSQTVFHINQRLIMIGKEKKKVTQKL